MPRSGNTKGHTQIFFLFRKLECKLLESVSSEMSQGILLLLLFCSKKRVWPVSPSCGLYVRNPDTGHLESDRCFQWKSRLTERVFGQALIELKRFSFRLPGFRKRAKKHKSLSLLYLMHIRCLLRVWFHEGLSPPNFPGGHFFLFFFFSKRATDRSRGDIPYKEKNAKNLKIAH